MTIGEIKKSIIVLLEDIGHAEDALNLRPTDPFLRRTYVRNSFSYIEGSIWVMKQVCLKAKPIKGIRRMTPGEFNILNEIAFDLKSNGDIKQSSKYLKLTDNFKFLFKTVNKLFNADIQIDYGGKTWANFLESKKIRDRLTHPKKIADFDITDQEIQLCQETCHWFNDLIHHCFKAFLNSNPSQQIETPSSS